MHNIFDCVQAFIPLLNTEYDIILGRKGVLAHLVLQFDRKDCFHLMGIQYLRDRPQFNRSRDRIFDEILNGTIMPSEAESSVFYGKIKERVNLLPHLEQIIDSNDTVFKYNEKILSFSSIQAEYLMENSVHQREVYLFLSKNKDNIYYCRSFFPKEDLDYTKGQASWTLLYKAKREISSGKETVLFDRLHKNSKTGSDIR